MTKKERPFDADELLILIARLAAKRRLGEQQAKYIAGLNAGPNETTQSQTDPDVTQ